MGKNKKTINVHCIQALRKQIYATSYYMMFSSTAHDSLIFVKVRNTKRFHTGCFKSFESCIQAFPRRQQELAFIDASFLSRVVSFFHFAISHCNFTKHKLKESFTLQWLH